MSMTDPFKGLLHNFDDEEDEAEKHKITRKLVKDLYYKDNIPELNRFLNKNMDSVPAKERALVDSLFSAYLKKTFDNEPMFMNDMFSEFVKKGFTLQAKSLDISEWRKLSAKLYRNENFGIYKYGKPSAKSKIANINFLKKLLGIPVLFKAQMVAHNFDAKIDTKLTAEDVFKALFKNEIEFNITTAKEPYSLKEIRIFAENISVLLDFLKEKELLADPSFKELHNYVKTPSAQQYIKRMLYLKTSTLFYQAALVEDDVKNEIVPYFVSMIEAKVINNSFDFSAQNTPSKKKRL